MTRVPGCPLCGAAGGHTVFKGDKFRVVRALGEEGFPAFYRVIWNDHVAEFSDLPVADRGVCMDAVAWVERVLRKHLHPAKINLASLGNVVPHLHWHVIARFEWDSRFPAPVWAAAVRSDDAVRLAAVESACAAIDAELGNCTPP